MASHPYPERRVFTVLAALLLGVPSLAVVLPMTGSAESHVQAEDRYARCDLVLAAVSPPEGPALRYATLDAAVLASTLETVMPYCGAKVMWYLVGHRIAEGELDMALQWIALARARTLLERMADPRAFEDGESWRYKRLDRLYASVLDPYAEANPDAERRAIERALSWDRLYPSMAVRRHESPGLHASMRARLEQRLEALAATN